MGRKKQRMGVSEGNAVSKGTVGDKGKAAMVEDSRTKTHKRRSKSTKHKNRRERLSKGKKLRGKLGKDPQVKGIDLVQKSPRRGRDDRVRTVDSTLRTKRGKEVAVSDSTSSSSDEEIEDEEDEDSLSSSSQEYTDSDEVEWIETEKEGDDGEEAACTESEEEGGGDDGEEASEGESDTEEVPAAAASDKGAHSLREDNPAPSEDDTNNSNDSGASDSELYAVGKSTWSSGLELDTLEDIPHGLISLLKEKVPLVSGFQSGMAKYDADWFHTYGGLERAGRSPESITVSSFDSTLWNKYWTKSEPTKKSLSSFKRLNRVLLKTCQDESFNADITNLYMSCYGGLPDNGYIGKKFMMAALSYLRGEPKIMFNWAAFAAKITQERLKHSAKNPAKLTPPQIKRQIQSIVQLSVQYFANKMTMDSKISSAHPPPGSLVAPAVTSLRVLASETVLQAKLNLCETEAAEGRERWEAAKVEWRHLVNERSTLEEKAFRSLNNRRTAELDEDNAAYIIADNDYATAQAQVEEANKHAMAAKTTVQAALMRLQELDAQVVAASQEMDELKRAAIQSGKRKFQDMVDSALADHATTMPDNRSEVHTVKDADTGVKQQDRALQPTAASSGDNALEEVVADGVPQTPMEKKHKGSV